MDAADLRIFEAVARTGSMSRAAATLNTVQSNVTARIKALEQEVGFALFERTNRGVSLTAAGHRLLPFAGRAARLLEDARRAVADDGTPSGSLVIGSLETTAALRLAPLLAEFAARFAAVDLSIRTGTTAELINDVLARRADGAFVCGPVRHPELLSEPFFAEELVLLTAPGVADLEAALAQRPQQIIVLKAGCSYRLRLEELLARRGIAGARVMEFGILEAVISCVSAGLGITLLPRVLIGPVWQSSCVRIHALPKEEAKVETSFIRHRDTYMASALRAFLDHARPALARIAAE